MAIIVVVATLGVAAVVVAALDAGYLHGALIHTIERRVGRTIEVGELKVHFLTRHPRLEVQRLTIGNPSWTKPGKFAQIGAAAMQFEWPRPGEPWRIVALRMDDAVLTMFRDESGRANWMLEDPAERRGNGLPLIGSLSLRNSRVQLKDERRHLDFDGNISIGAGNSQAKPSLEISADGMLNAHAAILHIAGEPLSTAVRDKPYRFSFVETSSGSRLQGEGTMAQPFDFRELDIKFRANGENLLDFYNLTGLKLLSTGPYVLRGRMVRRDLRTDFKELLVTSGESDMRGAVSVDLASGRRQLRAVLRSNYMRISDLGPRAARPASLQDPRGSRLFSDRQLNTVAVTRGDAQITYGADRLDAGPWSFRRVAANVAIDHGMIAMQPVTAELQGGEVSAAVKIDVNRAPAAASLEIQIKDVRSGQAIDGPLRGRLSLTGPGASVHQFAAAANGTIKVSMSAGVIRASLAEISSVDLRGVGLLLTHSDREVAIRCGIADFKARNGTLATEQLLLDTEPVLIRGSGVVHLDTEALEMRIEGNPKKTRVLRLRTPLLLAGPLRHPAVTLEKQDAKLKLIDRGTATDVDCTTLGR